MIILFLFLRLFVCYTGSRRKRTVKLSFHKQKQVFPAALPMAPESHPWRKNRLKSTHEMLLSVMEALQDSHSRKLANLFFF